MSFFIQKIVEYKEKFNNDELAKIRFWPARFDFAFGPVLSGPAGPEPDCRTGSNSVMNDSEVCYQENPRYFKNHLKLSQDAKYLFFLIVAQIKKYKLE